MNIIKTIINDTEFQERLNSSDLTEEEKRVLKIKELSEHKKSLEVALKLIDEEIKRLK